MGDIWNDNAARWGDDVALLAVNETGTEDGLHYIWSDHPDNTLVVLQDHSEAKAMWNSGASAYYFYVLDGQHHVAYAHYRLTIEDVKGEQLRVIEEIDEVLGRGSR